MKQIIPFIFSILVASLACGQSMAPGGVKDVSIWYITDANSAKPGLKSIIPDSISFLLLQNAPSNPINNLNFRPALSFSGNSQLKVDLRTADFSKASYFTVYQPVNISEENIIWHMSKDQKTDLVLTTSRMADLGEIRYMNFTDRFPLNPKVNTYVQQKLTDSIAPLSQYWNIGFKPANPQLPIAALKGWVPEIIAYKRVLNGQELLQVASYLAIKYGITLTEPGASYLNSFGQPVWDGNSYAAFHNNIAGIARDDSSGLIQKKAGSSNHSGQLTISTNNELNNNSFLLWGDNNEDLIEGRKIAGTPSLLARKWLMIKTGETDTIVTDLFIDTKQFDVPLPPKPVYWMAIDSTGAGDFSLSGSRFVRMKQIDKNGIAQFEKISWTKKHSKQMFGFVVAQELLLSSAISNPTCTAPNSGQLEAKIWGGEPPFQLTVSKNGFGIVQQLTVNDDSPIHISNITAGKYHLRVTDHAQHTYYDEFYVNNEDAPIPVAIESSYIVQEGHHLQLNAAEDMPGGLNYEWKGPENFRSSQAAVTITRAGIYTLTSSRNGCAFIQDILVKYAPKNVFTNILVYPNPSTGIFTVKVSTDKPASLSLEAFTEDGRLVSTKQLSGFANYTFTGELNTPGMYYLVFRSGLSKEAKKIIILR